MSLGGWWRLWLVGTIAVFAYNLIEAVAYRDLTERLAPPSPCVPFTTKEGKIRQIVGYVAPTHIVAADPPSNKNDVLKELREKVADADRSQENSYDDYFERQRTNPQPVIKDQSVYSCVSIYRLFGYLAWALALSVGAIAFGFLTQWIVGGFKEKSK